MVMNPIFEKRLSLTISWKASAAAIKLPSDEFIVPPKISENI
ncbi:MAG: hypothetical protein UX02_C0004G0057 [Candidatus Moranbacteria bacterium GW2011_GWC1_45_18]|nr:MAG: hypothetical protein UT79_C0003G0032 [Candidatus Moranbacteria bacterium GW2011_GWC2_40_12]KKT33997.1 MAG: hypothetical protein UW19_C0003G0032 [Candidatus Moranbacteria bacterium GW2011_GWF2_44_10]KKT71647.1 MAG: hypothetical protein UW66_C0025G0008 [Candidatus Moranbacteria bacterium GW2011_GWF1_44_4]KKT99337.1 MAG: hypothetical protein UX02_C0004G0057 [Candidatus Moranbacteria bacterium GW2011_GWC1_45_18]